MKEHRYPRGAVTRLRLNSHVLRNNLFGDPTERIVDVYVPAGTNGAGLPLLTDLVGMFAGGPAHSNWSSFRENVPERLDRLIAEGRMPPVVVAFPDCFTRLGGNQYINSIATGPWSDFLIDEMLPAVEREFNCGGLGRRGLFGKSSGGYGAIVHGLDHPDVWSAVACHSGDMAFELAYVPDFPAVLRALAKVNGSIEEWWAQFEAAQKTAEGAFKVVNIFAMAATYDPDPSAFLGIRLPVTTDTCELITDRWAAWLAHDPLVKLERSAENLRLLKGLYIDCGVNDQFNLIHGARRFKRRLDELAIPHRYEEFNDDHTAVDYRMDESLPYLAAALTPS